MLQYKIAPRHVCRCVADAMVVQAHNIHLVAIIARPAVHTVMGVSSLTLHVA